MSDQNKNIIRRVVDELWNRGRIELLNEIYHPDYSHIDPANPLVTDLDGLRTHVEVLRTSFPDMHVDIDEMIAEGDSVAKMWKMHGTFTADFMGIPANDEPVSLSGITVYRMTGGKIKECVWGYDNLGLMQQLGAFPAEAAATP
ncbi:MAG TPA: ester cyclase [Anaerolineales bacterium]|nr:ester cyclase [Anaerolineales bacterium]